MKKKIIIIIVVILLIIATIYFFFPGVIYNLLVDSARRGAGLERKSVQVEGHTVVYLEGGQGQTILLLHGLGGNKDIWAKFAVTIVPKYHVIALDLPGSGESAKKPTEIYNIGSQVERLEKIVDVLKLKKFHLAGTAMGGTIAGSYAVKNPGRLLSLCFFNTEGIKSPEKSQHQKNMVNWKNVLSPNTVEEFDLLLKFLFVEPPSIPGSIKKYLFNKAIEERAFNTKIFWDVFGESYSLEPVLGKIKTRTLIIWGDKDNKLHVSSTKVMKKLMPKAKVVIIKGAGHYMERQKPNETAKHYLEFLGKV